MSIVSDLLGVLDEGRALLDDPTGLRPFTVFVRVITDTGERPGMGTETVVDTPVTVAGGRRPKVAEVAPGKDVVRGGAMTKTRYVIGPITPVYEGGGMTRSSLDPLATGTATEVFYVLKGPGLPATGMLCQKVADDFTSPFRLMITVESLGKPA